VNKKILIVDDEELISKILMANLLSCGYDVVAVASGDHAYSLLERENFALVISDICMPSGDGLGLLKKLREKDRPVPPLIFMTGYSSITKEQAVRLGAVALVAKPFLPQTMLTIIQDLVPLSGAKYT
jgi:CheY-like chemotaxis protein